MTEPRIRGWFGEQSFELAEGHTRHLTAFVEAQLFASVYHTHLEKSQSPPHAREMAQNAVKSFREIQP